MRFGLAAVGCVAVVVAVAAINGFRPVDADAPRYRLGTVARGPMASTVAASGKLEAVVTVDVGTQVSGIVKTLMADFNSTVKAGQVIARIDPATFEARLTQAEAELAVAKANVDTQQATMQELEADLAGQRAMLAEADHDLSRKRSLIARHVVASSAVDTALSNYEQAKSRVNAALARLAKQKAQIALAHAQVQENMSAVEQRKLDLNYTYIRSPVDGVVINRNVDAGQTVAASLQAPVLFTIAQDLSHMQVGVTVDEADIGQVRLGQAATFTVDSYPGTTFEGRVAQIRKAGVEVSNVVTYTVMVTADNVAHRLLPGMTANVTIIVNQRDNALKVPNAALRFRPAGASVVRPATSGRAAREQRMKRNIDRLAKRLALTAEQRQGVRDIYAQVGKKIRGLRQQQMSQADIAAARRQLRDGMRPRIAALLTEDQRAKYRAMLVERDFSPRRAGRVWVLDEGGKPRQIDVLYGISDGTSSEIVRGDLKSGQKVITGVDRVPSSSNRRTRLRFGF